MKFKKTTLILLSIIFLALLFRISAVFNSKSFWFDEVVSLKIAQKGIVESWQYLQWENNPPLHYLFLHYWIKLFGESEKALRFSSVLFGLLSVIAIYFFGKKLVNKKVGLFAGFLVAISSYQIYISTDARMYPMLLFFGILSCYFFWQIISSPLTKGGIRGGLNWFFYILFTLLAFYTHLTGLFLLLSQNLYFIYHYYFLKRKNVKLKNWIYSQITILILFLPWFYFFVLRTLKYFNNQAWYLNTPSNGFFFFQLPFSFLFVGNATPVINFVAMIILGLLFIASFAKFYSWSILNKEFKVYLDIKPEIVFLLILFLIPLFIGIFTQVWVSKYYILGSIGLYLILAIGFYNLKIKLKYKIIFLILIFSLALPYSLSIIRNQNKHQWRNVARYIGKIKQENDLILIPAFVYKLPFEYYYKGSLKVIGYQPKRLKGDLLLKAVRYNWYPILNEENRPDINEIIGKRKRVIIINATVSAPVHKSYLVLDWFIKNGWSLKIKKQFGGFIQPEVLIFERPKN